MTSAGRKLRIFKKRDVPLYIMAAPTVLYTLLFSYIPMAGIIMAFQKYNNGKGIFGSPFSGFKNFEFLFASTDAWTITRNTLLYNVVFIVLNTLLSIIVAVMLSMLRTRRTAKVLQTVYIMPYFMSWAVVYVLVASFLEMNYGLVNSILGLHTNWYAQIKIWPYVLVVVNAWKNVGYNTVLYLAVISGISNDYYEAAVLDGASKFRQARFITLPHLRFVIGITTILNVGGIFRGDFGLFYTVPQMNLHGVLFPVTGIIDTYIYNGLQNLGNMGMATAAGVYQSVVGLIMLLAVNKIVSKIDPDLAMF